MTAQNQGGAQRHASDAERGGESGCEHVTVVKAPGEMWWCADCETHLSDPDEQQNPNERDLWWGHLCPALSNIGALKQAQSELMALGADWAQVGTILSRVQSFYVDAAHAAAQRYLEAARPAPLAEPFAASPADEGQAGEVEALAKVLGDIRIEQARQADWWTSDEDHALLAQVLRGECAAWAPGVLAAGYVSAAEVERLVAEAKVAALREAAAEYRHTQRKGWKLAHWLDARADSHDTGSERGKS